jgi:hypothetical protein
MNNKKKMVSIILAMYGIAVAVLYGNCESSCTYLQGSLFGIELNYLGIIYMVILVLFALLQSDLMMVMLSMGMGAELFLLGFQIRNGVYCYYCLAFGLIVCILFILNMGKTKKIFASVLILLGILLFSFLFHGSVTPGYAEDILLPSFGNGQIQVRLYTDYFCNPCGAMETKLEPIITELVKKGLINITFIDTPIHKETPLYAQFFLYILNEKKAFNHALRARAVLFEAAKQKITDSKKLEAFIRQKGIRFKPFDVKSTFGIFSRYLNEDTIKSTPTCIIYNKVKKERVTGADIVTALTRLR